MIHLPPHILNLIGVIVIVVAAIFVGRWLEKQKKQNPTHSHAAAGIKFCPNCGAKIEQADA